MGRIRTIKPEFFKHEELYDLEKSTGLPVRLSFAGLWCEADKSGRFRWKPRELKSSILPYDDIDFAKVLQALADAGFIVKYTVEHKTYGCIPSWNDHQHPNARESETRIPDPPQPSTCMHVHARGEGEGKEGKGKEGEGKNAAAPRKRDELFDALAEITHSDPKVSATHIGKVKQALLQAEPPYTAEEVRRLPSVIPSDWSITMTLGTVQKYIGYVRAPPTNGRAPPNETNEQRLARLRARPP